MIRSYSFYKCAAFPEKTNESKIFSPHLYPRTTIFHGQMMIINECIPTIPVTMWRRVFLGWRTRPSRLTLASTSSSWFTSSSGWAFVEPECLINFVSVHCCFGQVLVHVGALFLCRLLHHPTFFCIHLSGQNLDRYISMLWVVCLSCFYY